MTVKERSLSEFLQHSGRVLPDLAEGEEVLRRRSGEPLVLMTQRQREALDTMLRAFLSLARGDVEGINAVWPWFAFLSAEAQTACLQELQDVARAALTTGQLTHLADTLY